MVEVAASAAIAGGNLYRGQGDQLTWACWDGECVVFNTRSGDTHLLDIVGSRVLRLLTEQVADLPTVTREVARYLDLPVDRGLTDRLTALLAELTDLGLVDRLPPTER